MNEETTEDKNGVKLSNNEIKDLLIELKYSKYWNAITAYYGQLKTMSDQTMRSVDAFKNPTEVARNQGFYSALTYLEMFIDEEIEKRKREEQEEVDKDK